MEGVIAMMNFIVGMVILFVVVLSGGYIVKAKKSGQKCIGCPHAKTCGGGCQGCR